MRNKTYFLTGSPVRWNALRLPDVAESYLAVCPDAMQMVSSNAAVAGTSDPAEIDASSDGDLADADSQALEYAVYTAYADARSSAGVRRRASSLSSSAVRLQAQVSAPQMGEDIDPRRATAAQLKCAWAESVAVVA